MKQYKAVIFDIDGTLLDTFEMNMVPLIRLLKEELGINLEINQTYPYFFQPGITTMRQFGFPDPDASYARWVDAVNAYEKGAVPFEGVIEALQALQEGSIRLAVVSSKNHSQYGIDMVRWDMDRFMETAVLEEDTQMHKPHPAPLLECLKRLRLQPEDALYVGDAPSDGKAAEAAGIDFGFAAWGAVQESGMPVGRFRFNSPAEMVQKIL